MRGAERIRKTWYRETEVRWLCSDEQDTCHVFGKRRGKEVKDALRCRIGIGEDV